MKLAIVANRERGSEIIDLLKMLGGHTELYDGCNNSGYYTLMPDNTIMPLDTTHGMYVCLSVDEFWARYPYKLNHTFSKDNKLYVITKIEWNTLWDTVEYTCEEVLYGITEGNNGIRYEVAPNTAILLNVEDITDKKQYHFGRVPAENDKIAFNLDKTELLLGNNFEIQVIEGRTYVVKKKLLPMSYKEACEQLALNMNDDVSHTLIENGYNIGILGQLIVIKDAWHVMLGWKPDVNDEEQIRYCVYTSGGELVCNPVTKNINHIFAFPDIKTANNFLNNFKELLSLITNLI